MRISRAGLLLALLSVLLTVPAVTAAQGNYARLRGTITDAVSTLPISGVRIVVAATGRFVTSDSAGQFEVIDLPSGIIRFFFAADGYPRASVVLAFASGEVMTQRFELDSSVVEEDSVAARSRVQTLPATEVTAEPSRGVRYADFERRMKTGRGHYITKEKIDAEGYMNLTDAVRSLRGVLVECGGGRGCMIRMARANQGCYPQYIVDGREDNFFGPLVAVRDIEGLEIYTGSADVPGEFAGRNAGCGVVVIWTKSGPGTPRPPSSGAVLDR